MTNYYFNKHYHDQMKNIIESLEKVCSDTEKGNNIDSILDFLKLTEYIKANIQTLKAILTRTKSELPEAYTEIMEALDIPIEKTKYPFYIVDGNFLIIEQVPKKGKRFNDTIDFIKKSFATDYSVDDCERNTKLCKIVVPISNNEPAKLQIISFLKGKSEALYTGITPAGNTLMNLSRAFDKFLESDIINQNPQTFKRLINNFERLAEQAEDLHLKILNVTQQIEEFDDHED